MVVDVVFEERYWYPEDGGQVWLSGYSIIDADTGDFVARGDQRLLGRRLHVTGVAGAGRHHADDIQGHDAAHGEPLTLRRDPDNPHDPNAIAVHGAEGEQFGWVPRELAAEIAPEIDAGQQWSAVVLREQRESPRDPRTGLTMLLAPTAAIELVVAE